MRLANAVFLAIAAWYVIASVLAIYWHEYPRVRRLKRRVIG